MAGKFPFVDLATLSLLAPSSALLLQDLLEACYKIDEWFSSESEYDLEEIASWREKRPFQYLGSPKYILAWRKAALRFEQKYTTDQILPDKISSTTAQVSQIMKRFELVLDDVHAFLETDLAEDFSERNLPCAIPENFWDGLEIRYEVLRGLVFDMQLHRRREMFRQEYPALSELKKEELYGSIETRDRIWEAEATVLSRNEHQGRMSTLFSPVIITPTP